MLSKRSNLFHWLWLRRHCNYIWCLIYWSMSPLLRRWQIRLENIIMWYNYITKKMIFYLCDIYTLFETPLFAQWMQKYTLPKISINKYLCNKKKHICIKAFMTASTHANKHATSISLHIIYNYHHLKYRIDNYNYIYRCIWHVSRFLWSWV